MASIVGVLLIGWLGLSVISSAKKGFQKRDERAQRDAARRKFERGKTPGTPEWEANQARLRETAARELVAQEQQRAEEREQLRAEQLQRLADEKTAREEGRYITDWQSAEKAAESIMRDRLGLRGVRLTDGGPDGGVDVTAENAVAQVKQYSKKVGRPDVQRIKGAAGTKQALFFAVADTAETPYTSAAIDWANENGVALFAISRSGEPSACSDSASTMHVRTSISAEKAATTRALRVVESTVRQPRPGDVCTSCRAGKRLVRYRRSDGGSFLGCSNYPTCRTASPYDAPRRRRRSS